MYYYINSFYLYSFLGYIYETIVNYILYQKYFTNILKEPIKPIYGIGVIITIIIEKIVFNKLKLSKKKKIFIYTITVTLILTILEFISGHLLHYIFHKSYWNYTRYPLHLGKYICLGVSAIWGIFSIIYLLYLNQRTDKIIKKIPKWFSNLLIIITIFDILIALIH